MPPSSSRTNHFSPVTLRRGHEFVAPSLSIATQHGSRGHLESKEQAKPSPGQHSPLCNKSVSTLYTRLPHLLGCAHLRLPHVAVQRIRVDNSSKKREDAKLYGTLALSATRVGLSHVLHIATFAGQCPNHRWCPASASTRHRSGTCRTMP